jgi:RNA ligase
MITPELYFTTHNLWDIDNLKAECDRSFVKIATYPISPTIIMLHYSNEAQFDKLWNNFNRMCRGLIVDLANRKILAYPFDKFFNLDEMPETKYEVLEKLGSFEATEKLDGSLCILYKEPTTGEFRFTTKGSFESDHGVYATSIMPNSLKDNLFVENHTLMFELISSKFPIVIDYKRKGYPEGLYLIGIRHRYSNKLLDALTVQNIAKSLGVYCPKSYKFLLLDELIENVKGLSVLEEGYVLKFADRLVKVKGNKYLATHRFISKLSPKYILEALGLGIIEEVRSIAPEEYRDQVEKEITQFKTQRELLINECYELFNKAPKGSRKDFALWVNVNVPSDLKGFMFTLLDNKVLPDKKVYDLIGIRGGVSVETQI